MAQEKDSTESVAIDLKSGSQITGPVTIKDKNGVAVLVLDANSTIAAGAAVATIR